jgi:anaerobic ribonucleoside-triphosphate reductase activating protein
MTKLKINKLISNTQVEGPFLRSALWLQGCSILCSDCCNPQMLDPNQGDQTEVAQLFTQLAEARLKHPSIEGISILGGEPLEQVSALRRLLSNIKTKLSNYGIILFTGHPWKKISKNENWLKTLELCDLVIAGPYEKEAHSRKRRWIGSDNQTVHFITPRYKTLLTPWPKGLIELEITIDMENISVTGTPLELERKII